MTAESAPYAEVIGDPVAHSLSPAIHNFWLERTGIAGDYRRRKVSRAEFADYLERRRADPDWRGCNVTMPLKLDAVTLADEATDRAIGTGAANILIPREGKLLAGNTDVGAVAAVLAGLHKDGAKFDLVHILGSGGAARAALMALHGVGLSNIRIHSRERAEAVKLAVQFGLSQAPVPFDSPIDGNGLINATPLGMIDYPPLAADLSGIAEGGWVLDFITVPSPTPLLEQAAARGLNAVDGIAVLIEQAAESFTHFFGAPPPRDKDGELLARLRP